MVQRGGPISRIVVRIGSDPQDLRAAIPRPGFAGLRLLGLGVDHGQRVRESVFRDGESRFTEPENQVFTF